MNTGWRRLSIVHWSIWVKLLVGFSVALLILLIPAFAFMRSGVYEIGVENARSFVTRVGTQQQQAISSAINSARQGLQTFATRPENERLLIGLLIGGVRSQINLNLPAVDADDAINTFRSNLINLTASPYQSVRLLDRNGRVLVQASATSTTITRLDESNSPAYRAATSALLQGQSQALTVTERGEAVIEIAQAIRWRDGAAIGFLIAELNNSRVAINNLSLSEGDSSYDAFSFLTTAQGALITPANLLTRVLESDDSVAVERAVNGQSGTDVYATTNRREEFVGYYAPIGSTPLVLVTQTPLASAAAVTQSFFGVRGFVVALGVVALIAVLVLFFNQLITPPINRLRRATVALRDGDFNAPVPDAERGDEIGALAVSFVNMRDQVRGLVEDLESRVASRTRDITATQEISRFAATQRDLQLLMDRVVELIVDQFPNIYHAQIFLLDSERQFAVLRASTGEPGRELLARGHRLAVGSVSVIGQVTQLGRLVVARDTAASQVHRRNEFLPDTRAELAIPLRVGETVIGALDVQSRLRDAFVDDQVTVLQTMADQIAVAIQNARLYEESLQRVAEIEAVNRQATLRAWQDYMREQRVSELMREAGMETQNDLSDLRRAAQMTGEPAVGALTPRNTVPLAVPIKLRGQTLGAVEWEIPVANFGEDRLELARELANRLALSLDNARLFQESQRATERERLVNSIAAKLTAQTTINDILQTAVREVGQALRAPQVSIRLHSNGTADEH